MLFNIFREQVYHSQREGLSVCQRRHPCPKERGDQLLRDQGDPLSKEVKNHTLNTHRFGFFLDNKGRKSSSIVWRSGDASKMIEEAYTNKVKRSNRSMKKFIALK